VILGVTATCWHGYTLTDNGPSCPYGCSVTAHGYQYVSGLPPRATGTLAARPHLRIVPPPSEEEKPT
jgi:hypothetical protein